MADLEMQTQYSTSTLLLLVDFTGQTAKTFLSLSYVKRKILAMFEI